MTDYSQLSTEDLLKMRQGAQPQPMDLTNMSTDELLKLRTGSGYGEKEEAQLREQMPLPLPKPSLYQEAQTSIPGRALFGAMDVAHQGANLAEHALNAIPHVDHTLDQQMENMAQQDVANMGQREREYQLARKLTGREGLDVPRAVGNIGANLAALPGGAAPQTLLGRMAQGAGAGAVSGALAPVTDETKPFWGQVGDNAKYGAAFGTAVPVALEGAARVISPKASTNPDIQTLIQNQVRVTPGQMLGGALQRTEDKLTSFPILGDVITNAKQKSFVDLNRAAVNQALEPIGQKLPANVEAGHDAVNYAYDTLGYAYDAIKQRLSVGTGALVQTAMQAAPAAVNKFTLPENEAKQFANILQNQFSKIDPKVPQIDGETLKGIDSALATEARGYAKSGEWDKQKLGQAIEDVRSAFRQLLAQQNPQYAQALQRIDEGYARYLRVERASRAAGKDGVFTPNQYDQAVKMMAGGARGGSAARGEALGQDLSSAGAKVLPSQYPNSGTTGRTLLNLGTLGALGGAGSAGLPGVVPAAVGLAAASAPYIGPGRTLAEYALARRPTGAQGLAQALRGSSVPQLSGASAALARLLSQQSP